MYARRGDRTVPRGHRAACNSVDAALGAAEAALASLSDTLARARQRAAELDTLFSERQPVLVGAEQRLQRESLTLEGASRRSREDMAVASRAIEQAGPS
ncbi:MAG: hypothetical protein AAGA11_10375 [Pseudomonadota bacterium]